MKKTLHQWLVHFCSHFCFQFPFLVFISSFCFISVSCFSILACCPFGNNFLVRTRAEGTGSTNGQGLIWVRHKFGRKMLKPMHVWTKKIKDKIWHCNIPNKMAVHTNIRDKLYNALDVCKAYGSIPCSMTADRHLHLTFKGTYLKRCLF